MYRTVEVIALSDADLDRYAGDLVVLLRPSGIGESTRLFILGGLDILLRSSITLGPVAAALETKIVGTIAHANQVPDSLPRHVATREQEVVADRIE